MIISGNNFIDHDLRASFGQEAQECLLDIILKSSIFPHLQREGLQRQLAQYAAAGARRREVIVSEVAHQLLKEAITSSEAVQGKIFESFRAYDAFAVQSGKRYHYLHQFDVFLVGLAILFSNWDIHKAKKDYFGFKDQKNVFSTWTITSLIHDIGYPIESLSSGMGKLSDILGHLGANNISRTLCSEDWLRTIKRAIGDDIRALHRLNIRTPKGAQSVKVLLRDCIKNSLDITDSEANEQQRQLVTKRDHGYASALILCALLGSVADYFVPDEENYNIITKALGAVALHGIGTSLVRTRSLKHNPFAYLLFLCDNLQDWDRSFFHQNEYPSCCLSRYKAGAGFMEITYFFSHKRWQPEVKIKLVEYLRNKSIFLAELGAPRLFRSKLTIRLEDNCGTVDYSSLMPMTFNI